LANIVYNSTTQRWVQIRENGGTTYWEYSSDGQTWTTLHSAANPIPVTSIEVEISAGVYEDEGATTICVVDNFNIISDEASLDTLSELPTRRVAASLQVSWKKDFLSSIIVFTIGDSTIGGSDIIGGTTPIISTWNKYSFEDETPNLINLTWEQQLSLPMGGISIGLASASLDNTSGRYTPHYMGGDSAISTAILPRRPFIINAGFEYAGVNLYEPQFVGELSRNPMISASNKIADIQGEDFIAYLKNKRVDDTQMFTGEYSSSLVERVLRDHVGLNTAQYDIEQGINNIPFSMLESGTTFYDYINEIAQAEMAQFFQDENGILRYWNRQHWDTEPYSDPSHTLLTSDVIEAASPDYDHIINSVFVKANPLQKQSTTIFTLVSSIELEAGRNEIFIDFENPVLAANTPSFTANTSSDGSGSNVTGSVSIISTDLFAKAAKYIIDNNSGTSAYLTTFTVAGRWAVPIYEGGIFRTARDDSSVTAYDEQLVEVNNNYIQDETWANSFSQLILNQYAEPENIQRLRIRAKPGLHIGDIMSWQGREWMVFSIGNIISTDVGYLQDIQVLRHNPVTYFSIGVSSIGGIDRIAA
jgi:hypothetical protein